MKLTKKRTAKQLILVILVFIAIAGNITDVWATNSVVVERQTKGFYVNDFAGVFSAEQKRTMMNLAVNLDKEFNGIQVVVTTVKSFGDYTKEEYATEMYNQYKIGANDMGVLVLLSTGDREIRLETGQAIEPYITDSIAGRIIDKYGIEYFKKDQFAEGLVNIQQAVIDYIQENIPKDWNSKEEEQKVSIQPSNLKQTTKPLGISKQSSPKGSGIISKIFLTSIIFLIFIIMYLLKYITNHRKKIEDIEKKSAKELKKLEDESQRKIDDAVRRNKIEIEQVKEEQAKTQSSLNSAHKENSELKYQLENLQSRYIRAKTLFPNLDNAIDEMIEKEFQMEAKQIDAKINSVSKNDANKDNVSIFREVLDLYRTTNDNVRKYITEDIAHIEVLYKNSVELEAEFHRMEEEKANKRAANKAFEQMRPIADKCWQGTHENYEQLVEAEKIYLRLNPAQRKMFPNQVWLDTFQNKLDYAKKDYKHYQKAKEAEEKVQSILSRIGVPTENDRDKLKKARKEYKSLNQAELQYFDNVLWTKLQHMIRKAEEDYEENERKRRNARMTSVSTGIHSGSSFGSDFNSGHGGSSFGGGAGRSF